MRLLSAGPCCEIKGHSHWMSNPCSDLFSPRPTGKSSAIRTGGASFIIVVIIGQNHRLGHEASLNLSV